MSKGTGLGDRMKENYENRSRFYLTRRTPVIIRLDGRAFHTFTRGCEKPFDDNLMECMDKTTEALMREVQGAVFGYVQSDEISIFLKDYKYFETQAWFDYNLQKITSISASIATVHFNEAVKRSTLDFSSRMATFDSRAFNLPKNEVVNYFIWRQQDWIRNSIMMVAQANYSHKELMNKNVTEVKEMLKTEKDIDWESLEDKYKFGRFFINSLVPTKALCNDLIPARDALDSCVTVGQE